MMLRNIITFRCAIRYIFSVYIFVSVVILFELLFYDKNSQGHLQHFMFSKGIKDVTQNAKENVTAYQIQQPLEKSIANVFETVNIKENASIERHWDEYRNNIQSMTGNPLIDDYDKNDISRPVENGGGVTFVGQEKNKSDELLKEYHVNVYASDIIPLNRRVPDARLEGCKTYTYPEDLPSASMIIPFHDEWLSILLRTIYSIVNRTPRKLLKEIILVDDASEMVELQEGLDEYVASHFPRGLVKVVRAKERGGLIQARLLGWKHASGEVIVIFDSHMEVNIDWLPPLLAQIKYDRKTVAMSVLDYIQRDTMEYKHRGGTAIRYGFDWRLVFFETIFRQERMTKRPEEPKEGTVMGGSAFAMDRIYFGEVGSYDEAMTIWGGENLEMTWRVWLCGGRFVHVPCSHIGHIARSQPYSFPAGRKYSKLYNYKRAIEVWMEPEHKSVVYKVLPQMTEIDVGDLTERLELKKRLQCKPFSWFLENIWPELFVYNKDVIAWGSARNLKAKRCLDNNKLLYTGPRTLYLRKCHNILVLQGFSWTVSKLLRTSLQCVVVNGETEGTRPKLQDCIIKPNETWLHKRDGFLKHERTGLCLDLNGTHPIMKNCNSSVPTQSWQFTTYVEDEKLPVPLV